MAKHLEMAPYHFSTWLVVGVCPLLQLPLVRANPTPPPSVPDTSLTSRPRTKGSPPSPGHLLPLFLEASMLPWPGVHTTSLPQAYADLARVQFHLKTKQEKKKKTKDPNPINQYR